MSVPADYPQFEATVEHDERADVIWRVTAYRMARYLMPLTLHDARILHALPLGRPITSQLWRSVGSIAANIAEGYSRGTGPDRARFLEYALGSSRESIVWYEGTRTLLPDHTISERLGILHQIKRLVLASLPGTRRRSVRE